MDRKAIQTVLEAAQKLIHHKDYVIIGSLSVLGCNSPPPERMLMSIDVDLYPKNDPDRASDLAAPLGLGSEFEQRFGYYVDPVSPFLPTLPAGWESRLIPIVFESGVAAWFLEPNDAAVSKYARLEDRDKEWIRAGLLAGILSVPTLRYRFRETVFFDTDESARAKRRLEEDAAWLDSQKRGQDGSPFA